MTIYVILRHCYTVNTTMYINTSCVFCYDIDVMASLEYLPGCTLQADFTTDSCDKVDFSRA